MAIDRHQLTEKVLGDAGDLATATLIPDSNEPEWLEWPVEKRNKAAHLLYQQAGYSANHPLSLTLAYPAHTDSQRIMLAVMHMWEKVLGIKVTLASKEWSSYLESIQKKQYTITRSGVAVIAMRDPALLLELLVSNSSYNHTNYSNTHYDTLVFKGIRENDSTTKWMLYKNANLLLQTDNPIIPLYRPANLQLISPRVKGFIPSPIITRNRSVLLTVE